MVLRCLTAGEHSSMGLGDVSYPQPV
jgi:hypothetical protein